jgi:hypothetical protein
MKLSPAIDAQEQPAADSTEQYKAKICPEEDAMDFIRVTVSLSEPEISVVVIIDRKMSIGYITRQIEAAIHYRLYPTIPEFFLVSKLQRDNGNALLSDALVGDTIENHANLRATGMYEHQENQGIVTATSLDEISRSANTSTTRKTSKNNNLERFINTFHNLASLFFFTKFCAQEYLVEPILFWIEVEVYKTIKDPSNAVLFGNYIYLQYLADEAPLNINLKEEVRKNISWSQLSELNLHIFDEAQGCICSSIKRLAFREYENSSHFQYFLKYREAERYSYIQASVVWNEETVNVNYKEITEIIKLYQTKNFNTINDDDYYAQLKRREKIFTSTFLRYFPTTFPPNQTYKQFYKAKIEGAKMKIDRVGKQKKLHTILGAGIPDMAPQPYLNLSYNDISDAISDENSDEEDQTDKKARGRITKSTKLNLFFGDKIDQSSMQNQNLFSPTTDQCSDKSAGPAEVAFENHNNFTVAKKVFASKKAKKLALVLGMPAYEPELIKLTHNASSVEPVVDDSLLSIDSYIFADGNDNVQQKERLNRLTHILGARITEGDLALPIAPANIPRALTVSEKQKMIKKVKKLESILGVTVHTFENKYLHLKIIDREERDVSQESLNLLSSSASTHNETRNSESEKNRAAYNLNKARKLLGNSVTADIMHLTK